MSDLPAITLPRAPESATPFRFPLLATLAPVVVSVALWLVTGSVFALMFAALGPITALASFIDSRLGSRRTGRRERQRFDAEVAIARSAIRERHAVERAELAERLPDAAAIARRRGPDPARWLASTAIVTLGSGRIASATTLEPRVRSSRPDAAVDEQIDELVALAAALEHAPIAADASLGIGVVGPRHLAIGLARGLAMQLAWALAPDGFWCAAAGDDPEAEWLAQLPHRRGRGIQSPYRFEFGPVGSSVASARIAVSSSSDRLPGACRVVLRVGGGNGVAVVQHPDRLARQALEVAFVSREEARSWAMDASAEATRSGLAEPHTALPASVALAPLLAAADGARRTTLAAQVAETAAGPLTLDLVDHGPHAVVGGTTGSGKSELLISWVLAMAAAHPPDRVTFLLVDFKGGAAFDCLRELPHTVGTITDLDARAAARALASLRAELAHRERALARVGARNITDLDALSDAEALPRLVIVVDEFAAMIAEHPDLHALFADLAARGRSLGVHLVLCTQRPAGVVRDGVLANADLRISLRVNNPADSIAVVGTDEAARIAVEHRGRAVVAFAGAEPRVAQFALAAPADAGAVASRWEGSPTPRRPWLEPLPRIVTQAAPEGEGTAFGVLDLPAEQRRATAMWRREHGHVLVLGAPGTGKSAALRALCALAALEVPAEPDAAWDVVDDLVARLDAAPAPLTVAIDDLDALLARFSADYRAVMVERLTRVLREGDARGIRVAITAQRATADLHSLASLVPARLWLRHSSRNDLVLAGGDGANHDDRLPPGAGTWRGDRVQVLWRQQVPLARARAFTTVIDPAEPVAIVTSRPAWVARELAAQAAIVLLAEVGPDPSAVFDSALERTVLIGDVDDWQSRWGALAALRPRAGILFHGCSVTDFRALTRLRDLPPPLASDPLLCWRLGADGAVTRARLLA